MKSRPGVWFATHEQIVRYVQEQVAEQQAEGRFLLSVFLTIGDCLTYEI